MALLEIQAAHPDTTICAYLDDTYYLQEPPEALAAMCTGDAVSSRVCGVVSNLAKQEVYGSPAADLSEMPPTLRGSPHAPADGRGYAGGRLLSLKMLGAYLGDMGECSRRLCERVERVLRPLEKMCRLRDTRREKCAMQVQLEILRFCGNTCINYFLRTMGVWATRAAAARHDALIEQAFHKVVGTGSATAEERSRSVQQARLTVPLGGMGLVSQSGISRAACVGSWALVWRPMQLLCPQLFANVDIATSDLRALRELRQAHGELLEVHARVAGTYDLWDATYYDYDKDGEGCTRFHPAELPPRRQLQPLSEMSCNSDLNVMAQATWSQVIHHSEWLRLATRLASAPRRELVRLVAVSQPYAGVFLNAVPKYEPFRMQSWAMRIAVQKRLGLPLLAAAAAGDHRSKSGRVFDAYGDVAQNDGAHGHQSRHWLVLEALYDALKRAYGAAVKKEPTAYRDYSDTRPDLTLQRDGLRAMDLKVLDPIGSVAGEVQHRGAFVGLGNTHEEARELVVGRLQRGAEGDGTFKRTTGAGYVAPKAGAYARAQANGVDIAALLVEPPKVSTRRGASGRSSSSSCAARRSSSATS